MTRPMAIALASLTALVARPAAAEVAPGDGPGLAEYQRELSRMLAGEAAEPRVGLAPAAPAPVGIGAAPTGGCTLAGGASVGFSTRDCVACHAGHDGTHSHPVDVDLEAARSRSAPGSGPRLRPAGEVVAAGVFLPDGKVTCLACHDGASPWKYHLAIPPEATLVDAVHPGDPTTYGDGRGRTQVTRGLKAGLARAVLPYGTEVSPAPLCKACHAFD